MISCNAVIESALHCQASLVLLHLVCVFSVSQYRVISSLLYSEVTLCALRTRNEIFDNITNTPAHHNDMVAHTHTHTHTHLLYLAARMLDQHETQYKQK